MSISQANHVANNLRRNKCCPWISDYKCLFGKQIASWTMKGIYIALFGLWPVWPTAWTEHVLTIKFNTKNDLFRINKRIHIAVEIDVTLFLIRLQRKNILIFDQCLFTLKYKWICFFFAHFEMISFSQSTMHIYLLT